MVGFGILIGHMHIEFVITKRRAMDLEDFRSPFGKYGLRLPEEGVVNGNESTKGKDTDNVSIAGFGNTRYGRAAEPERT
jgi:hypothetical protein